MGFEPPPSPLSRNEFQKRIDSGCYILNEIDPAFCSWMKRRRRVTLFGIISLFISIPIVFYWFI